MITLALITLASKAPALITLALKAIASAVRADRCGVALLRRQVAERVLEVKDEDVKVERVLTKEERAEVEEEERRKAAAMALVSKEEEAAKRRALNQVRARAKQKIRKSSCYYW